MIATLLMAGGSKSDPILAEMDIETKSLIKIHGKEMVRYVAEALAQSGQAGRVLIIGLDQERVPELLDALPQAEFLPDQGGLVANVLAGMERMLGEGRVLMCSADIPLITGETIRGFLRECAPLDADVYYPVVEQSVMEARFPQSQRTFVPLREGRFAGGDMAIVNPQAVMANRDLLTKLVQARKHPLALVRAFGPGLIVRFLTRTLTLQEAERKASQVLRCRCRAIPTQYAELGMDVDKAHQLHLIQAALAPSGS